MNNYDIFDDYAAFKAENDKLINTLVKNKSKTISRFTPVIAVVDYLYCTHCSGNNLSEDELLIFSTGFDYIYDQFDLTFGNRILTQIDNLVPIFVACGGTKEDALDFLLSRKVIYKLEGRFEEYVKGALKELLALIEKTYGASVLKRSEKTIKSLMRRL